MIPASLGSAEPFGGRELGLWEQGWQYSPLGTEGGMWIWVTASAAKERSWSEPQGRSKPSFLEPQRGHFIPPPSLHPYLANVSAISSLSTLPVPSAGPPCPLPALSWAES